MRSPAIVDTSALLAAADRSEPDHAACVEVLGRRELELVVPALVVAEAAYLVGRRLGPGAEAAFVRGLASLPVEAPLPEEWSMIGGMLEQYEGFDIGATDASVAVLADRLGTDVIVTLDRRHFGVIRSPGGRTFMMLPEPPHGLREPSAASAAEL